MSTEPHNEQNVNKEAANQPTNGQPVNREFGVAPRGKEAAFIAALRGEDVREIDRYQVYSDYREGETVVFIHEPTGRCEHKYIFAKADGHTYIVAAPMEWTGYHREILARVSKASGSPAHCPGGGYVQINQDGSLWVGDSSGDFGPGNHARAKEALERAVRRTGERQGTH